MASSASFLHHHLLCTNIRRKLFIHSQQEYFYGHLGPYNTDVPLLSAKILPTFQVQSCLMCLFLSHFPCLMFYRVCNNLRELYLYLAVRILTASILKGRFQDSNSRKALSISVVKDLKKTTTVLTNWDVNFIQINILLYITFYIQAQKPISWMQ